MKVCFLFSLIFLFSFSFINVSTLSENFDMTVFSSIISIVEVFKAFDITTEIVPKLTKKEYQKLENISAKEHLENHHIKKKKSLIHAVMKIN